MRWIVLLFVLALSSSATAAPQAKAVPPEVRKHLAALNAECRGYGGQPGNSPGLIKVGDLTGDSAVDYVIDLNGYNCEGAASAMAAGQSGAGVAVFASGPGGAATKVYENTVYAAAIDTKGPKPRLYLDLGGVECGQKNAAKIPFSNWKFCSRPVDWNPAKRTFDLAPLAQARMIQ